MDEVPNTLLAVRNTLNTDGSANLNLTLAGGATGTLGVRLGTADGVLQAAPGRTLTVAAVVSERVAGSGLIVQGGGGRSSCRPRTPTPGPPGFARAP